MAFIHHSSCECAKAELDIFSSPATQTSVESGDWIHFKTVATIGQDSPLEFHIPAHSEEYLDLSQTQLKLVVKLVQSDGTDLTAAIKAVPVNNFLHSLFSDVTVSLNQKIVTPSNNLYPYRAYLQTLFNYNEETKYTRCQCELWYADTPEHFEDITDDNVGYQNRATFSAHSRPFDVIGRPYCDIFLQNRFLINGVDMVVKFSPTRPSFCLMSADAGVQFKILDATLQIRKLKMSPSLLLGHAAGLEKANCKIPIQRVDVKSVTIPRDVQSKTIANHYLGQLPTRIIIGFVANASLNGSLNKNPFNFAHFDVNYLSLHIDGRQIPSRPLTPDYENNLYIEAYNTTFTGTNLSFKDDGHSISRTGYPNGFCLYCFDLTSDLSSSECFWSLRKQGTLHIEVKFKTVLTSAVSCVTFAEFQSLIEIDKQRNIYTDF